jgi:hypothetical protein
LVIVPHPDLALWGSSTGNRQEKSVEEIRWNFFPNGQVFLSSSAAVSGCLNGGSFPMGISTILLIIVILLLIGAVPAWPHSRSWGYGPSGLLGVVLLILIILLLMGRL